MKFCTSYPPKRHYRSRDVISHSYSHSILLRLDLSVLVKETVFWFMYVYIPRSVQESIYLLSKSCAQSPIWYSDPPPLLHGIAETILSQTRSAGGWVENRPPKISKTAQRSDKRQTALDRARQDLEEILGYFCLRSKMRSPEVKQRSNLADFDIVVMINLSLIVMSKIWFKN